MAISVIVYCPQSPLLAARHVLHSLRQQEQVELEVLLYYARGVVLPDWLPSHWQREEVADEEYPLTEIWSKGLCAAQGDWICFAQPEAFYHPLHFAVLEQTLRKHSEYAGAYAHCQFLDLELYPLDIPTPHLTAETFQGYVLPQDCLVPLGAFLFSRASLSPELLESDHIYYLEEAFLARWLTNYALLEVAVPSVKAIPQRNRLLNPTQVAEEFIRLYRTWLKEKPPEQLAPPEAFPHSQRQALHALRFILDALHQRRLPQEALIFVDEHCQTLYPAQTQTTLWIVPESIQLPAVIEHAWEAAMAQGEHVVVVRLSTKTKPRTEGIQVSHKYRAGISTVEISNISASAQQQAFRDFSGPLSQCLKTVFEQYKPDRVHVTSFDLSSLHMSHYLMQLNIPLYYSFLDAADLNLRHGLRTPDTKEEGPQLSKQEAESLNYLLQELFERWAARICVYKAEDLQLLEELGLKTGREQVIHHAQDILAVHRQPFPAFRKRSHLFSLELIYQLLTRKKLSDRAVVDQSYFQGCRQVMVFGPQARPLLQALHQQNIPASGLDETLDPKTEKLEPGLLLESGGIHELARYVHRFDGLHAAYVLERMTPEQLLTFLQNCNLAMQKGGRLLLRTLNPENNVVKDKGFWMDEAHQRPYPQDLLAVLLKHCGFELLESKTEENDWEDNIIEAILKFPAWPLANTPISTQALSDYWKQQLFSVNLSETDRVLVIGPHIQNLWLMYRVQCASMTGLSFNLAEITGKYKPGATHQLHYTRHLLSSLQRLKGNYDIILWQGVAETLLPQELEQVLLRTHALLSPHGQLHIQALDPNHPLFWHCLLHRRPYPDLTNLLESTGFKVVEESRGEQHKNYHCQPVNPAKKVSTDTTDVALPGLVKWYLERRPAVWQPTSLAEIEQQAADSQPVIWLGTFLQTLAPQEVSACIKQLFCTVQTGGDIALQVDRFSENFWKNNTYYRYYPYLIVDKMMKEQGFSCQRVIDTDSATFWLGRKLRSCVEPDPKQRLTIHWQGNFLNYHSFSGVNRYLAQALLKRGHLELSISHYRNPSFDPKPGEAFYDLKVRMFRPLLESPDVILRHFWPPDFEAPPEPGHWVIIQPWEFGSVPERWIYNMNKYVDQIWVPTHFVKESYIKSGLIPDKIRVVPNGVDTDAFHPEAPPLLLNTQKSFKFLFVGGIIQRKGIDVLLQAYTRAFKASDDVCLVIKEFGSGTVYDAFNLDQWLEIYRTEHPDMPEVLVLTEEMKQEEMPSLYTACNCLVHPYRAEGFGLPIAEAMAAQRPVIVTDFGAALDFCHSENAYLIPAEKYLFPEKQLDQTLVTVDYPFWVQPDPEALAALMRHVYENPWEAAQKAKLARQTIVSHFTWDHAAEIAESCLQELIKKPIFRYYRTQILGNVLGQAFDAFAREEYQQAIEKLEYVLAVDPYQPDVAYNLGLAYMMAQDYPQALKYLSQSLREGTCTADLCYAMGTTLRHLGDYQTAEHFFHKARELDASSFAEV